MQFSSRQSQKFQSTYSQTLFETKMNSPYMVMNWILKRIHTIIGTWWGLIALCFHCFEFQAINNRCNFTSKGQQRVWASFLLMTFLRRTDSLSFAIKWLNEKLPLLMYLYQEGRAVVYGSIAFFAQLLKTSLFYEKWHPSSAKRRDFLNTSNFSQHF